LAPGPGPQAGQGGCWGAAGGLLGGGHFLPPSSPCQAPWGPGFGSCWEAAGVREGVSLFRRATARVRAAQPPRRLGRGRGPAPLCASAAAAPARPQLGPARCGARPLPGPAPAPDAKCTPRPPRRSARQSPAPPGACPALRRRARGLPLSGPKRRPQRPQQQAPPQRPPKRGRQALYLPHLQSRAFRARPAGGGGARLRATKPRNWVGGKRARGGGIGVC
jgi:hypothetical protein